jgi:hypothetical protein
MIRGNFTARGQLYRGKVRAPANSAVSTLPPVANFTAVKLPPLREKRPPEKGLKTEQMKAGTPGLLHFWRSETRDPGGVLGEKPSREKNQRRQNIASTGVAVNTT